MEHKFTITGETYDEIEHYINGPKYLAALMDIYAYTRNGYKHVDEQPTWNIIHQMVCHILEDNGVEF